MKIGINARTFGASEPDGAVQTARKITRELEKIDCVNLVLFGSSSLEKEFPTSKVVSSGFFSNSPYYGAIWERTILPILANNEVIDVLICPNGNAPITSGDMPIVTYIHDVNAINGMSSKVHQIYRKISLPLSVQSSSLIVTVSNFSKREIKNNVASRTNIDVIYNGVDNFFLKQGGSQPFELPDNYLLYIGAMNPRKNVSRLIKSYLDIKEQIPHKLVLIGPSNKSVYKNIDLDGMDNDIITPGFVSQPNLKYAYENADLFVFPSLYEGFGLPPLEALACSTPVVASNTTSIPEVLDGMATLVDPTNTDAIGAAILSELESGSSTRREDERRQYAQRFTWSSAAEELLNSIKEVS